MPPAWRALLRQQITMVWLMVVYMMHGQVKELTYMHSEGIQVSFETEILGELYIPKETNHVQILGRTNSDQ